MRIAQIVDDGMTRRAWITPLRSICRQKSWRALTGAVIALVVGCGGPGSRVARESEPATSQLCDPRRLCPVGSGLCIRCDSHADPQWHWSTAAGSAAGLRLTPGSPTGEPECGAYTFDSRGNPMTHRPREGGDLTEWSYDAGGRVVRVEIDQVEMCEGSTGDMEECGPPDGRPDVIVNIAWRALADGTLASGTVEGARGGLSWRYDALGRLVEMRSSSRSIRTFEYGDGPEPVRVTEAQGGITSVELMSVDAAGRPIRRWALSRRDHQIVHEVPLRRWRYDLSGRLVEHETGAGARLEQWSYRELQSGALRVEYASPEGRRVTTRHFDDAGLLVGVSMSDGYRRIVRGEGGRVIREEIRRGGHTTVRDHSCHLPATWRALAARQPRVEAVRRDSREPDLQSAIDDLRRRHVAHPRCGGAWEGRTVDSGLVEVVHRLGATDRPDAAIIRVMESHCVGSREILFVAMRRNDRYAVHPVHVRSRGTDLRRTWEITDTSRPEPGLIRFDRARHDARRMPADRTVEREGTRCEVDALVSGYTRDAILCRTGSRSACRVVLIEARDRVERLPRCRSNSDGAYVDPPPWLATDGSLSPESTTDAAVEVRIDGARLMVRRARGEPSVHRGFGELPRAVPLETFFDEAWDAWDDVPTGPAIPRYSGPD